MNINADRPGLRRRPPPGVSLVVVISLLGLLAVLAVSLLVLVTLSRQTNQLEAESRKAEMLAQAAFNTMLVDLNDEMEKGSTAVVVHKLADGTTYRQYDLTKNRAAMRVTPSLGTGAPAGGVLIKQSQAGQPFHTWKSAPPSRASSVATSPDPIPATEWNLPKFLASTAAFTDTNAPTWIYVSRDGANPLSFSAELKKKDTAGVTNPKFVIGRYAYNLYDTSGLLDINVAGHPADPPDAQQVGAKGSLMMADLAVLPGMTAAGVAQLAKWKHEWTASTTVTTPTGPTTSHDEYLRKSEGSGWQQLAANDNLFLSRQDLLDFAKKQSAALPQEALPFLTHFSRDLNSPTYRPDPNRKQVASNAASGGNDAFGADRADDPATVNPDLTAYDTKRERQLLPRRFPLERLKWVATPGASGPADAEKRNVSSA